MNITWKSTGYDSVAFEERSACGRFSITQYTKGGLYEVEDNARGELDHLRTVEKCYQWAEDTAAKHPRTFCKDCGKWSQKGRLCCPTAQLRAKLAQAVAELRAAGQNEAADLVESRTA